MNDNSASSYSSLGDKILRLINTALMIAFVVFEQESWGKYVYLGFIIVFFIVFSFKSKFKIETSLRRYHVYTALFAVFCLVSMLWAQAPSLTYRRMTTVVETILFMWVLFLYYKDQKTIQGMLDVIYVAGIIVSIYAIYIYGLSNIRLIIASGDRAGNSFTNINTIGMMSAISLVIVCSRIVNRQYSINMLFSIPCLVMVLASGSRKAFAILGIGIVMLFTLKAIKNGNSILDTMLKVMIIVAIVYLSSQIILSASTLRSVSAPMMRLFHYFGGSGATDESVRRRMNFFALGFQQFARTPLFGLGIGNSSLIIGRDTYLHSNYIELLACGGIVGFLIYYLPHIYIVKKMIQLRFVPNEGRDICVVLLLVLIICDFGQVSYFSKENYYYLMILFVHVQQLIYTKQEDLENN